MAEDHRAKRARKRYEKQLDEWKSQRDTCAELLETARDYPGQHWPEFVCKSGELVCAKVTSTALIEDRRGPGQYRGKSSGVSLPIGFGIRYRAGHSRGHYVQGTPTPTAVDVGTVYLTNTRLVFTGNKQTRECLFDKMMGFEHDERTGTTVISVSNRQKPTRIQYGPEVSDWFSFRMELALAHHNGTVAELTDRLQQDLHQFDRTRPIPPEGLTATTTSDGSRSAVGEEAPSDIPIQSTSDVTGPPPWQPRPGWGTIRNYVTIANSRGSHDATFHFVPDDGGRPHPMTVRDVDIPEIGEFARGIINANGDNVMIHVSVKVMREAEDLFHRINGFELDKRSKMYDPQITLAQDCGWTWTSEYKVVKIAPGVTT